MNTQPSPKIIGAFVIGFALVAGAYVTSNFGKPTGLYDIPAQLETQQAAPLRSAIAVTDKDGNGVEDWRDEFVTTAQIVLDEDDTRAPYTAPTTLTGQTGINFIQDMIRSRSIGGSDELIIKETINAMAERTAVAIYDTPDISIITEWDETIVKKYANAVATAIIDNNATDLENELFILQDILNRQDKERIKELETLAELYRLTRDAIIAVPVPTVFVKEHLDLINTLHAIHNDILGMALAFDDPAFALLRLKRYEDDVFGMVAAFENLYAALVPYANLFSSDDPAVFFTQFSQTNRIRI